MLMKSERLLMAVLKISDSGLSTWKKTRKKLKDRDDGNFMYHDCQTRTYSTWHDGVINEDSSEKDFFGSVSRGPINTMCVAFIVFQGLKLSLEFAHKLIFSVFDKLPV